MRLLRKPARWMCLPASFAMVLDLPLSDIFAEIGHDGSEIKFPLLPEPMCRRGFHPQELIDVCLAHRCAATRMELAPCLMPVRDGPEWPVLPDNLAWRRFTRAIDLTCGVIAGDVVAGGAHLRGHAVAYEFGRIFDPDGREYDYSREACERRGFYTQHLWRIDRI
jgi:hypothetical protein